MRKLDPGRPLDAAKLDALREVASRLRDRVLLFLFGSHARGDATPLSDVDLAYLPLRGLDAGGLERFDVELYTQLSRTLGTDDFTLVHLPEAPPRLAFAVLREGELLCDPGDRSWTASLERVLALYPEVDRLVRETLETFAGAPAGELGIMAIDRGRVLDQLRRLATDIRRLKERAGVPLEVFLRDTDARDIVERRLQTALECCVNVGNHLIARLGLPPADDYAGVFLRLGEAGILPDDLARSMAQLARLRNLIVHLYWRVEYEKIHRALPERIASLEAFLEAIRRDLGEAAEEGPTP